MERLDFASVMAVLRRNIPDENFGSQTDFLDSLFADVCSCSQSALEFDNGQVCRWINGMAKLSPVIITHYQDPKNQRALNQRIQNWLLPLMPDSAMAAQELERLHTLLVEHSKVFLQVLARVSLQKRMRSSTAKQTPNSIYVNYPRALKQAVLNLDFAEDMPGESDNARFRRHNRFLRSLREDTLLIVDNFNVTAAQDPFLDVMLKYRCRILFTTRSRYDNHDLVEMGFIHQKNHREIEQAAQICRQQNQKLLV